MTVTSKTAQEHIETSIIQGIHTTLQQSDAKIITSQDCMHIIEAVLASPTVYPDDLTITLINTLQASSKPEIKLVRLLQDQAIGMTDHDADVEIDILQKVAAQHAGVMPFESDMEKETFVAQNIDALDKSDLVTPQTRSQMNSILEAQPELMASNNVDARVAALITQPVEQTPALSATQQDILKALNHTFDQYASSMGFDELDPAKSIDVLNQAMIELQAKGHNTSALDVQNDILSVIQGSNALVPQMINILQQQVLSMADASQEQRLQNLYATYKKQVTPNMAVASMFTPGIPVFQAARQPVQASQEQRAVVEDIALAAGISVMTGKAWRDEGMPRTSQVLVTEFDFNTVKMEAGRAAFLLIGPTRDDDIRIEVKSQTTPGSAGDKLPTSLRRLNNAAKMNAYGRAIIAVIGVKSKFFKDDAMAMAREEANRTSKVTMVEDQDPANISTAITAAITQIQNAFAAHHQKLAAQASTDLVADILGVDPQSIPIVKATSTPTADPQSDSGFSI